MRGFESGYNILYPDSNPRIYNMHAIILNWSNNITTFPACISSCNPIMKPRNVGSSSECQYVCRLADSSISMCWATGVEVEPTENRVVEWSPRPAELETGSIGFAANGILGEAGRWLVEWTDGPLLHSRDGSVQSDTDSHGKHEGPHPETPPKKGRHASPVGTLIQNWRKQNVLLELLLWGNAIKCCDCKPVTADPGLYYP